jgi:hypothetical protein
VGSEEVVSDCYLARYGFMVDGSPLPPCDGQLIKAHLLPRQLLKREGLAKLIHDDRTWVWACGGIMGNAGCHGRLDASRTLKLPFEALPQHLLELADEVGLFWWLEREYPRLEGSFADQPKALRPGDLLFRPR